MAGHHHRWRRSVTAAEPPQRQRGGGWRFSGCGQETMVTGSGSGDNEDDRSFDGTCESSCSGDRFPFVILHLYLLLRYFKKFLYATNGDRFPFVILHLYLLLRYFKKFLYATNVARY
ncbi:hypothetical protein HanHA300_Chr06g0203761 [Helianthus annuus]|uniref:Uncharacterized protein n=1 Tax=Helianthus annuus TaxID=4232 RepID=A0A251UG96_HELAN|nr:uncharacterized protein LOC110864846 isoform X2 [Helianthus annuus]KAJ0559742.1 hypothetical protein HanHA300_Chr06g0203761 [Helianthus annuus]KAJ0572722.1 hypothetical protein HanHA89_Chr06g0218861 [Helianthus annuus]KAJ0737155.1 hypothetical protein HanLR1_Chr06g0203831 [Helianthus annuus]